MICLNVEQCCVSSVMTTFSFNILHILLHYIPFLKINRTSFIFQNKFFDSAVDEFINGRKANPEFFNVLNHGDSWSNNILFKYSDDGKLEDCLFVDFQNTNYGSPAQDLLYFIISSTQVDIKVAKFEYLIHYYHQHLVENLRLLKYPAKKIPSLRELHKQLIAYGSWATVTCFMTMGVVLLDPTDEAKFENFMGEEKEGMDFKNSVYSNPRYLKHINEVLPWLHNRGFMETKYVSIRHSE